jgi:hypothetical protein
MLAPDLHSKDLDLTPDQQEKVRQPSKGHHDKIQKILGKGSHGKSWTRRVPTCR